MKVSLKRFVMVPCAGAVPLGVIITSGQSTTEYQLVFSLCRTIIGSTGFGGQGYLLTFMTDDSEAEHAALMTVWPETISHLCLFHVQQAAWRWLWDSRHSFTQEDWSHWSKVVKSLLGATLKRQLQNFTLKWSMMTTCGLSMHSGYNTLIVTGSGVICVEWHCVKRQWWGMTPIMSLQGHCSGPMQGL